jgi:hypothetical protein
MGGLTLLIRAAERLRQAYHEEVIYVEMPCGCTGQAAHEGKPSRSGQLTGPGEGVRRAGHRRKVNQLNV